MHQILDISNNIRGLRDRKGYSVYKLSKLSGISITHIKKIEDGELSPRIDTISVLLDALDHELIIKPKDKC